MTCRILVDCGSMLRNRVWIRPFSAVAGTVFLIFANIAASQAATAFFYSEPEQYYGWAAGYNYSRSEREAHEGCNAGGSACKFVLECDGGWSAVAFADEFAKGVAFACGFADAASARSAALVACIAEAKTLCWTSSTISNGGNERSEGENTDFDMAWYAQQLLYVMGFEPGDADGEFGGKSRTALRNFQTKLGLEPTGRLDWTVFHILLDAAGGRLAAAQGAKNLADKNGDKFADRIYARAVEPNTVASFSEEIAKRTDDQRRMTLATLLSMWDTKCTLPAKAAQPVPEDGSGGWWVTCDEGDWTVMWTDQMHMTSPGHINITTDQGGTSSDSTDDSQQAPDQQVPDQQTPQRQTQDAGDGRQPSGRPQAGTSP